MKKLFLSLTLALTVLSLSACSGLTALAESFEFASDDQLFSFSAISTSQLLSDTYTQPLSSSQSTASQLGANDPNVTMEQIQPYLEMFETLLSQNNGLTVVSEVSDNVLYETMNTFTVYDLLNNPVSYVMYYNSTILPSDDDSEQTDEINQEESYQIDGILIIDTVEYQFTGKKEFEEGEEKVSFKSYTDENNYVDSQYKVEDGEKKFSIKVVEDGVTVNESKIKVEIEGTELSIKLEYNQGANHSEYKFKYEVENGINILGIKYETMIDGVSSTGKITVQVLVDELTNQTSYQIYVQPDDEDEYEHESERKYDNDNDDEDDTNDDEDDTKDQTDDDSQDETDDATSGATTQNTI